MPLDLDNNQPIEAPAGLPTGEQDREGAMAKADLFKLANYAHKLFQQINDEDQLESWVQAKITKAADYIASVYHYLEYEMKFSEYGKHLDSADTLSESQKVAIKNRLMEARAKVAELKKVQAEKQNKVEEGILSGGEQPCAECGGTGVVTVPGRTVPEATKEKVRKYNTMVKATKAAHKRLDANKNGIPDDEEVDESWDDYDDDRDVKAADDELKKHKIKLPKTKADPDKDMSKLAKKTKKEEDDDLDETYGQGIYEGKPSAGLSKSEKSATVKKAKKGEDIGKPGKNFAKVASKAAEKYGSKEKGEKVAAAAMWKNIKETTAYVAEKAEVEKKAKKDYDGDGKIESGKEEHAGSVDKAIKASKAKEVTNESVEFDRLKELTTRLLG